ncbi:MAG: hypothetical protein NTU59_03545 [Coprothermobacterota bacterium]|nr:hypothetical protein [Coprothermobacterota bacterium]
MEKKINYRKLAFQTFDPPCAHCGFGIPNVLEVPQLMVTATATIHQTLSFPVRTAAKCTTSA